MSYQQFLLYRRSLQNLDRCPTMPVRLEGSGGKSVVLFPEPNEFLVWPDFRRISLRCLVTMILRYIGEQAILGRFLSSLEEFEKRGAGEGSSRNQHQGDVSSPVVVETFGRNPSLPLLRT
jgi:hypothetical protein